MSGNFGQTNYATSKSGLIELAKSLAQEVTNVALFLSSDRSKYITGETISVNGGLYFG